jgi:hypothetical protein
VDLAVGQVCLFSSYYTEPVSRTTPSSKAVVSKCDGPRAALGGSAKLISIAMKWDDRIAIV